MKKDKILFLLLICILLIPAIWAFFVSGYYGVSDDMHVIWLQQMYQSILSGKFPVRYIPDLSYGFGYPLFNYVFPLPFYIGAIIHAMGFSLTASLKTVFLLSLVLSFLSFFYLLKITKSSLISLVGALLYIYAPYRATNVFVRGAVGESFAFIFPPLIILSLLKLSNNNNNLKRDIALGALSVAGLILSHNISAYMFLPFAGMFTIFLFITKEIYISQFINHIKVYVLGLIGSLFFWFPAIKESNLVKYDTVFNFVDHFPTIKQLVIPFFGYGASVPGPYDGMSFFVGIPQLLVIVVFVFSVLLRRVNFNNRQNVLVLWVVISLLISIFMMNYRSTFIWDLVPLIKYFQFPWRFLSLVIFFTSCLFFFIEDNTLLNKIWISGLGVMAIYFGASYFKPEKFIYRTDEYYLNRYLPVPKVSAEYRQTGEEYLRLPIKSTKRPSDLYSRFFTYGQVKVEETIFNSYDATAKIETNEETVVNYNKYLFPGWVGKIDNKPLPLYSGMPFGQISFIVPQGKHNVFITYLEPKYKIILDLLSFSTLLVLLGLLFKRHGRFN